MIVHGNGNTMESYHENIYLGRIGVCRQKQRKYLIALVLSLMKGLFHCGEQAIINKVKIVKYVVDRQLDVNQAYFLL